MKLIIDGVLQVKVGDTVVQRNGDQIPVHSIGLLPGPRYSVKINGYTYSDDGSFYEVSMSEDIVAIMPDCGPQGEPGTFKLAQNATVTSTSMNKVINDKPSRMIDLFAQGVVFVKDRVGNIWKMKGNYPSVYNIGTKKWEYASVTFLHLLFNEATVTENPEKPKRVVYSWLYKINTEGFYYTTSEKYETADEAQMAFPLFPFILIEKIEHSREEV